MTEICTITQEQIDNAPVAGLSNNWPLPGVTGPGDYVWNEAAHTFAPVSAPTSRPYDFDGGFGIGGLGNYQEPHFIPTEAQMARLEEMEARASYCRRCGESDLFDGAMFTTGGGDICDDCF